MSNEVALYEGTKAIVEVGNLVKNYYFRNSSIFIHNWLFCYIIVERGEKL